MKKLQNLGKVLSRQEQKRIIGGDYGGQCECVTCFCADSRTAVLAGSPSPDTAKGFCSQFCGPVPVVTTQCGC